MQWSTLTAKKSRGTVVVGSRYSSKCSSRCIVAVVVGEIPVCTVICVAVFVGIVNVGAVVSVRVVIYKGKDSSGHSCCSKSHSLNNVNG